MGIWLVESIKLLSFGYVLCIFRVVYIAYKALFKALFFAKKTIYSLKNRKKTLESIPDLDKALVNKRKMRNPGTRSLRLPERQPCCCTSVGTL